MLAAMAKEVVLMDLTREQLETGRCAVRCGASRENVTIYPDGTVVGCECRSEELGNLREVGMDLSKIWYGEAARHFRKTLERDHCTNHHHGYLALPMFRTPTMWPRLIRAVWKVRRNGRESRRG